MLLSVQDPSAVMNAIDDVIFALEELGLDASGVEEGRERKGAKFFREQLVKYARAASAYQTIILVAALVSAANLMLAQRRQRIREIGIGKAMGGSFWRLFGHFMRESLIVGGLAGLLGGAFGVILSHLVGRLMTLDVTISVDALKLGLLVSLTASFIVGIVPAWLGARMDPVKALRHE